MTRSLLFQVKIFVMIPSKILSPQKKQKKIFVCEWLPQLDQKYNWIRYVFIAVQTNNKLS